MWVTVGVPHVGNGGRSAYGQWWAFRIWAMAGVPHMGNGGRDAQGCVPYKISFHEYMKKPSGEACYGIPQRVLFLCSYYA